MTNNETISTLIRINKTMTIKVIKLGIYKHDTPDGTLTLSLKDGATTIASKAVTMADLDLAVGTFFHGHLRFEMDARVNIDPTTAYKELTLEVTLTGHTDDNNNYIAIKKQSVAGQFADKFGTIAYEDGQSAEQLEHFQPLMLELYKN